MENLKERFLRLAEKVYGDKYDYSEIGDIENEKELLPIICPEHGLFYKSFRQHLYDKRGCPECSKNPRKIRHTEETFLEFCKDKFKDTSLSFEKTKFVNNNKKVCVTCHEIDPKTGKEHGDFEITPLHLKDGQGCPICRYVKSAGSKRRSVEEVIEQARSVHGDKYDYSRIKEYQNDRQYCEIVCHCVDPISGEEHGPFFQTMNNHIKGKQGCPKCGRISADEKRKKPLEYYIEMARGIHGDKYEYLNYDYKTQSLLIRCPNHGEFWQSIGNHVYNREGCKRCGIQNSDNEFEMADFISNVSGVTDVMQNKIGLLEGKYELDIYIPDKKIAFEYDGVYWHSEEYRDKNYHLEKTKQCEKRGIRLIHIFEDEWLYKQDIVKSMIKNIFGQTTNRIYARTCELKEVDTKDARRFLDENHLQGYCNSSVRFGLYHKDKLVSLMAFGKTRHFVGNKKYEWELVRFCNKLDTNVVGGASKLLKHFIEMYKPKSIVSYADRRWSNGNLYEKLGFEKYGESKPNYYYVNGTRRIYRFNLRKSVLVKKYGCPQDMSEHEFCLSKGWYRIYDCGCLCYRMVF